MQYTITRIDDNYELITDENGKTWKQKSRWAKAIKKLNLNKK